MPQRSKVFDLPPDVKAALDRRLVTGGFAGYLQLAEWLDAQGYGISKSALHRYGQQFEERLAALKVATEQARAIAEAAGDDAGALNDALIRLIQEKAFSALVEMEEAGELDLIDLGNMAAKLGQTSVQQKKWMDQIRMRTEKAGDEAAAIARKGGLSDAGAEEIRRKVLGVGL